MSLDDPATVEPKATPLRPNRRPLLFALMAVCFLFILSYTSRLGERAQLHGEIAAAQAGIEEAEAQLAALQDALDQVQSDDHVGQIARDEIGMAQPGDQVMVVVDDITAEAAADAAAEASRVNPTDQADSLLGQGSGVPVWRQWFDLFVAANGP